MSQIEKNTVSSKSQVTDHIVFENAAGMGKRILFLGNSITRHAAKPEIGWMNDWGMAASAKENDYVHLIMAAVHEKDPDAAFCICQAALWEREYDHGDRVYAMLTQAREFAADVIIMRIIENCPIVGFDKQVFKVEYLKLVQYLNVTGTAKVILTSSFWERDGDDIIQTIAEEMNWHFVYLGDLGNRADMRAEGIFAHSGVACHPGNLGMKNIARRILEKMYKE